VAEGPDNHLTVPPTEAVAVTGETLEPESEDQLTVNLTDSPFESVEKTEPALAIMKESGAKVVAYVLVGTFSGVIVATLLIALAIIVVTGSPDSVKRFTDTLGPLFESLGKFVSPVFGPLLAFVLGYYFSKEQRKN
jgi:hypothetical protein